MQPLTSRRLLAGAIALLVMLTACGGGDEEAKPDKGGGGGEVATNDETTTTSAATRASCTPTALTEAVASEYADAAITQQSCSSGFGIALITAGGLDKSVAFFKDDGGKWVFLTTGAVDAATGESLPEGFPNIVFDRWIARQLKKDAGPATTTETSDDDRRPEDGPLIVENTTTTTAPPPTTTTTTGPPTTLEPQLDPYCIEFPEEPSCLDDPFLP